MIPQILTMISSEGEQWGRYNLPRSLYVEEVWISSFKDELEVT